MQFKHFNNETLKKSLAIPIIGVLKPMDSPMTPWFFWARKKKDKNLFLRVIDCDINDAHDDDDKECVFFLQ